MQVNMLEAKNQLSRLVNAAQTGEDVVIAQRGIPAGRLVPINPGNQAPLRLKSRPSAKPGTEATTPATSDLGLGGARMLVQPMAIGNSERLHRTHSFLQLFPLLAIEDSTVELATELRGRHRLRTPDALHLATALSHGCQSLITNDRRLSQAAGDLAIRSLTSS
jgi:prevent-host-death family protein